MKAKRLIIDGYLLEDEEKRCLVYRSEDDPEELSGLQKQTFSALSYPVLIISNSGLYFQRNRDFLKLS